MLEQYEEAENEVEDEAFAEHLSLRHTISHTDFELEENKPKGEHLTVALEVLAILGLVGINIALLLTGKQHPARRMDTWSAVAGLVTWVSSMSAHSSCGGTDGMNRVTR